jgi:bifunctional DNA-binding transcriptional regulator/antitoxin component of YhaV-PrlF toxin-antitoxin module
MKKKINVLGRIVIPKEMIRELNWAYDDYNEIDVIVKVHSDKELYELEKCVRIRRHYKDEDNILKEIERFKKLLPTSKTKGGNEAHVY